MRNKGIIMFNVKKAKDLVLYSLVADSYSLGVHWVYDEKQLKQNSINWEILNAPLSVWHKGKGAGEFTHFGDQTCWLYEFLKDKDSFDENEYMFSWYENMKTYNGYVDGASRETIQNIVNGMKPSGSTSTDLSVIGRIAPLLKVSNSKQDFLENVEKFVRVTHNSAKAVIAANFFAKLLLMSLEGKDIEQSIISLKDEFDSSIQNMISKALESKDKDTYETIRHFGPACDIDEGFGGVIHLLCKFKNLKDMLICNAKAGGDTSSRAMIATIIFMANKPISQIPQNWLAIKAVIE
jgi:ADP-ribosylglycohydrolase